MSINSALQVRVHSIAPEGSTYLFIVQNSSSRDVRNIEFSFYDILGPSDFGLDDTHMPASLTSEAKCSIASLAPGEERSIELKKWGTPAQYRGVEARTVRGRFADGSPFNGHTLFHEVPVSIHLTPIVAK